MDFTVWDWVLIVLENLTHTLVDFGSGFLLPQLWDCNLDPKFKASDLVIWVDEIDNTLVLRKS